MNIREITPRIFYVGVDDHTTTRFEGLWPLPNGVSYNSYIVKGEKVALIDCVEISKCEDLISHIHNIVGDTPVAYLVINHMEPDHSGGIPVILDHYPELKLIGNRQTLGMVKGYYGIDDSRMQEIADGEILSLGDISLKFILTPMVHWPETMMTWCEEEHVLFSGDAFGTFGALNGGVVDYEFDVELYFEEMYRYYANIVGKYGRFVQNALKKVQDTGLTPDYICSTHGPVWHDYLSRAIDLTDRLSRHEGEKGVTIVYGSMYGTTEGVAEKIARAIRARGIKQVKLHNVSYTDISYILADTFKYQGLIIGSPTYSMTLFPPVQTFLDALVTRELKNKVLATFGEFTWAPAAAKKLNEYAGILGMEPVDSFTVKMAPTDDTQTAIDALAEKVVDALNQKN